MLWNIFPHCFWLFNRWNCFLLCVRWHNSIIVYELNETTELIAFCVEFDLCFSLDCVSFVFFSPDANDFFSALTDRYVISLFVLNRSPRYCSSFSSSLWQYLLHCGKIWKPFELSSAEKPFEHTITKFKLNQFQHPTFSDSR